MGLRKYKRQIVKEILAEAGMKLRGDTTNAENRQQQRTRRRRAAQKQQGTPRWRDFERMQKDHAYQKELAAARK